MLTYPGITFYENDNKNTRVGLTVLHKNVVIGHVTLLFRIQKYKNNISRLKTIYSSDGGIPPI